MTTWDSRPALLAGLIGTGIGASLTPALHEREGAEQGLRLVYRRLDLERLGLGVEALPELLTAAERESGPIWPWSEQRGQSWSMGSFGGRITSSQVQAVKIMDLFWPIPNHAVALNLLELLRPIQAQT